MPSFSAHDEEPGGRSAGRAEQPADRPDWSNDHTMPIRRPRQGRWSDRKLLVLACVSGLVLILLPPLLFTVLRPLGSSLPGSGSPGVPAGGPAEPPMPPAQLSEPMPAAPANLDSTNRLVVLARGWNGEVQRTFQREPGSQPVDWHPADTPPGRKIVGQPVLAKSADGKMSGFAISTDGRPLFAGDISSTAAHLPEWRELPGQRLQGTPAAMQAQDGRFVVFARDVDGALWETHQLAPAGADWSKSQRLDLPPVQGDPVVFRDIHDKLRVFALGEGGAVHTLTETGPDTYAGDRLPGAVAGSSPAVACDGQGRLQVFTVGIDGALWHTNETGPASGEWVDWRPLGGKGQFTGEPLVAADPHNTVGVYAINKADGSLMHSFQVGMAKKGWAEPFTLLGSLTQLEAVAPDVNGHMVVFGIGINGAMEQNYQTKRAGGPWKGWMHSFGGTFPQEQSSSP
ncbi:hypothetical protein INP57_03720 [Saccharopolyspora sp. HNM0986]|uniref:hypothetical protein n=1 Tax=Saccharopolyspora galaxeae TaxID=2781241 RepID=UPI00190A0019|nr:hypothetical protein [Saccharopolyspora sp. HNM0986]MBK0865906.1 hypothetical protein [Saccharopolyspora sp. HNM0986]